MHGFFHRHTAGKWGNMEGAAAAGGEGKVVMMGAGAGLPTRDPSSLGHGHVHDAGHGANGEGGGGKKRKGLKGGGEESERVLHISKSKLADLRGARRVHYKDLQHPLRAH